MGGALRQPSRTRGAVCRPRGPDSRRTRRVQRRRGAGRLVRLDILQMGLQASACARFGYARRGKALAHSGSGRVHKFERGARFSGLPRDPDDRGGPCRCDCRIDPGQERCDRNPVRAYGRSGGFLAPLYYITRRARMRQTAIARQLSDVLDLLVVCVEAGLGLFEAIKIVGIETRRQKQEIGEELSLVASEIQAGSSLGQALRNLAERTAVEDIKPLAATLIQSEQLGAQIAPAL